MIWPYSGTRLHEATGKQERMLGDVLRQVESVGDLPD